MKNLKLAFLTVLSLTLALTSCHKDNLADELNLGNETIENSTNGTLTSRSLEDDETLIVLSAPSVYNNYYSNFLNIKIN